jgi:hypothetical protein
MTGIALALGAAITIGVGRKIHALQRRDHLHREHMARSESELRRLSADMLRTHEAERKALSLELHDEVGQTLTALGINIANIERLRHDDGPEFKARVEPAPAQVAPTQPRCFETFAEAISFATKGTVRLATDATPEVLDQLDAEQQASLNTYLIAVEYLGLYHDAYWGSFTAYASVNCDQGYTLSISNLQGYYASNNWTLNDSIGSARTFPGCLHGYHYDYPNFGGAVIDCPSDPAWNCYYSMGAMNDRTSSIRWMN